jgi:hypothetical protein
MALRDSMEYLVEIVSALVNETDTDPATAQRIQDYLDRNRVEGRYLKLTPVPTRASGGAITYITYQAPAGWVHWEDDASLVDYNYDALSPATSDWITGRWTFSTEPTRPVYILGWSYDIYGAAADLLEIRGSELAEKYDSFAVFNGAFAAARREGPLEMAKKYRAMQRTTVADVYRTDVNVL